MPVRGSWEDPPVLRLPRASYAGALNRDRAVRGGVLKFLGGIASGCSAKCQP